MTNKKEYKLTTKKECPECNSRELTRAGYAERNILTHGAYPTGREPDATLFSCDNCGEDFLKKED